MLILASRSPRRKELLQLLGLPFDCRPSDCDESCDLQDPVAHAAAIARRKAEASAPLCEKEDVIISSDTVVCVDGQLLGKPADEQDARRMLALLSGREHTVATAVTVLKDGVCHDFVSATAVRFRPLTPERIAAYVATGEPMDKAGAYGIQGKGALLVESITGDYPTVVGLPIAALAAKLEELGVL